MMVGTAANVSYMISDDKDPSNRKSTNIPASQLFNFEWENPYFGEPSIAKSCPQGFSIKCRAKASKNAVVEFYIYKKSLCVSRVRLKFTKVMLWMWKL